MNQGRRSMPVADFGPAGASSSGTRVPLVVSVVVHYTGIEQTRACLRSLLASDYDRHRIVLVDNASPEPEAADLRTAFGDSVDVITSERNGGYGAGANLGIRRAFQLGAAYVWVLNNDTIIPADTVRLLVDVMEANPRFGAISPQISAPIGPEAPTGVWFSGGTVDLARGRTRHSTTALDSTAHVVPTGYVSGCAMFLRSSAVRAAGLFWEALFLFWEDTELSMRLEESGWQLGVAPGAWIKHDIHGSVSSRTVSYYYFRNAIVTARQGSRRLAASAAITLTAGMARRWVGAFLRRRPRPVAQTAGLLAGIRALAPGGFAPRPGPFVDMSSRHDAD
jgi:hypothetical protein